ncbi:CAP domain-containing protein [Streptomyces sp. NPDC048057]|uniref:CAP domain-containing protein n=1 Tax=Streptomyces sp. NPDC048057 TaxID=3155628 RepID=UPI0033DB3670
MGRHRSPAKRRGRPVRTGLLGASAAVAMGAVAVASGLLPGGDVLTVGGEESPGGPIRTGGGPATLQTQGDSGASPTTQPPAAGPTAPHLPSTSPSGSPSGKPSAKAGTKAPEAAAPKSTPPRTPERTAGAAGSTGATEKKTTAPQHSAPSTASSSPQSSATPQQRAANTSETKLESEVLALVNQERAKVGCSPVQYDAALAKLAGNFSSDMAKRGFFSHTDPDGDTPWDRADQAGVKNLAAENIARGQGDAAAVMESWMNSDGHRANILNCDYKTLGVGVHLGDGGPWWTQNFGF